MKQDIMSTINSMCVDDIEVIYLELCKILDHKPFESTATNEIIRREHSNNNHCPRCGSLDFVRNGTTKTKKQKYICKDCKKSFSDSTSTIIEYTRKPYCVWKKFIYCELHKMPLRVIAKETGISTTTAFLWRHKLHLALKTYVNSMSLSNVIQLDALYTGINLKGTKPNQMPRFSKKRPSSAYRGLSHHKVCIMSGVDQDDHLFMEIVGLGKETTNFVRSIEHKIVKPKLLITDQFWGFTTISKEWKCELDQVSTTSYKSEKGNTLATLNGIHHETKAYLGLYRGVSIRHLQGYLDMFVFIKNINYKIEYENRIRETFRIAIPEHASIRVNQIYKKELPINLEEAYGEYNYGIFNKSVL